MHRRTLVGTSLAAINLMAWGGIIGGVGQVAAAQSATADPAKSSAPARKDAPKAADDVPVDAKDSPFYQEALKLIPKKDDKDNKDKRIKAVRETLSEALSNTKQLLPDGVGKTLCSSSLCAVRVEYPDVATFKKAAMVAENPDAPFSKFQGSGGRTALVKDGDKLVAIWFALAPATKNELGGKTPRPGFFQEKAK